jgi:hypothetical protein
LQENETTEFAQLMELNTSVDKLTAASEATDGEQIAAVICCASGGVIRRVATAIIMLSIWHFC